MIKLLWLPIRADPLAVQPGALTGDEIEHGLCDVRGVVADPLDVL